MSEEQVIKVEEELPIKKYLESIKKTFGQMKNFDFRKFFQGIFTFLSIIAAYFIIEITHQHASYFQQLTTLKLKQAKTIPLLFYVLSLYLIFWNIVARFLKNRALSPPPKSDEYEEIPETEEIVPPTLAPLPNGEHYTHEIIEESLTKTVYFALVLGAVASYAFFNQQKRKNIPPLVTVEKINLLGVWFLIATVLSLIGQLMQNWTKIGQFRVIGMSMAFIVGFLALGLANGLNTFIFI